MDRDRHGGIMFFQKVASAFCHGVLAAGGGVLILVLLLTARPVVAASPGDEARAQALFAEVRCVVCQSESIADSDADIAGDMRAEIRGDISAGLGDDAIRKRLYDRYGDYVLFRPRVSAGNFVLWAAPPLIVGVGILILWRRRKKFAPSETYGLSASEQKKLHDIMNKPE